MIDLTIQAAKTSVPKVMRTTCEQPKYFPENEVSKLMNQSKFFIFPTIDKWQSIVILSKIFKSENVPFSTFTLPTYRSLGLSSEGFFTFSNHKELSSDGKTISLFLFVNNFF